MSGEKLEDVRIILNLLESVERDSVQSQRRLAAEFGVALGLVNAYVKRCVRKGFIKVTEAPAQRYRYYLTPLGFAEKSRLTLQYLSYSLQLFRRARSDCSEVLAEAKRRGWTRLVLAGVSDLAEISAICALERDIKIAALVDPAATATRFVGAPVFAAFDAVPGGFDGILVTDMGYSQKVYDAATVYAGAGRVLAPQLLGIAPQKNLDAANDRPAIGIGKDFEP